jgi:type IV pilus assembly protein PilY1
MKKLTLFLVIMVSLISAQNIYGAPDKADYQSAPFMSSSRAIPRVLLILSKDHKMFMQAYNTFTDYDEDKRVDTGFNPSVIYNGYFDPRGCYSTTATHTLGVKPRGNFQRVRATIEDQTQAQLDAARNSALGSAGSNIRAARATHYKTGETIGICQTPNNGGGLFSGNFLNYLTASRMDVIKKILYGGSRSTDTATKTILEASYLSNDAHSWANDVLSDNRWVAESPMSVYFDISKYTPYAKPNANTAHFFVRGSDGSSVIRYLMVAPNAQLQNQPGRFYMFISSEITIPDWGKLTCPGRTGATCAYYYEIRVEACKKTSNGPDENCREYPNTYLKPTGLLQKYGENGDMYFGLLTGSFGSGTGNRAERLQGGVLRSHINHLANAINPQTGQIVANSIIKDLDNLRISGRTDRSYNSSAAWGNPVGEMLYEGVRYFARLTQKSAPYLQPTSAFSTGTSEYVTNNYESGYDGIIGKPSLITNWNTLPSLEAGDCSKPIILMIGEVDTESDGDTAINSDTSLKLPVLKSINAQAAATLPNYNTNHYLDRITDIENLKTSVSGAKYFFATSSTDSCAPKNLTSLKQILGLCPNTPSLQGTYSSSAVSYYAHTHNFSSNDNETPLDVYTVTMSPTYPPLEFPVYDSQGNVIKKISVLPGAYSSNSYANNRLVSFISYFIVDWKVDQNGTPYHVVVRANYEDAFQGYDTAGHDWDMDIVAEYTIDLLTKSSTSTTKRQANPLYNGQNHSVHGTQGSGVLKHKDRSTSNKTQYYGFGPASGQSFAIDPTEVVGLAVSTYKVQACTGGAGINLNAGYTIAGTTHDGTYMEVFHSNGLTNYATPATCYWLKGYGNATTNEGTNCLIPKGDKKPCSPGTRSSETLTRTFEFSTNLAESGTFLPNPLFLAAKYGGFTDSNSNGRPDQGEWEGADGVNPKNYFFANNISELSTKLEAAFNDISKSVSTGTATAASVNSVLGGGISVLTAYYPLYVNPNNAAQAVSWVGTVYGLFVDKWGNLREDTSKDGMLSVKSGPDSDGNPQPNGDYVLTFNSIDGDMSGKPITRSYDSRGNGVLTTLDSIDNIHKISPVWDAGRRLAEMENPSDRNIYFHTGIGNQVMPFVSSLDTPVSPDAAATLAFLKDKLLHDNYLSDLLKAANNSHTVATTPSKLISYIRGKDYDGWRSRTIANPWANNPSEVVWRMGDIINSKPIIVGPPAFNYDLLYRDSSYAAYKASHATRDQVVYVGSNDGLLHAIYNGKFGSLTEGNVGFTPVSKPLGQELWAFIPYSVLPHLQWLADPQYVHAYYVDLKPMVADIEITTGFQKGWKTVLIGGLRLGGRTIPSANNPKSYVFSEIFCLDVTNPNTDKPNVLWRFSAAELGLSVANPAVIKSNGKWYVVLASGPTTDRVDPSLGLVLGANRPYDGYSNQKARLIILDAETGLRARPEDIQVTENDSFFTDSYFPVASKYEKNNDDLRSYWNNSVVYYGLTISRDAACLDKGAVYRLITTDEDGVPLPVASWYLKRFVNLERPVTGAVNSTVDYKGNHWILFGTGRLWGLDDLVPCSNSQTPECEANHQQYLFGIKEPMDSSGKLTFDEVSVSSLRNVSGAAVYDNGMVTVKKANASDSETILYSSLSSYIIKQSAGYMRQLDMGRCLYGTARQYEMVVTQPKITALDANRSIVVFTSFEPKSGGVCGDFGSGYMYMVDTFTGLPAPYMASTYADPDSPIDPENPRAITGGISTGSGKPSEAILLRTEHGILARSTSSNNRIFDLLVENSNTATKSIISWKEVTDTGFTLTDEVMTQDLDE